MFRRFYAQKVLCSENICSKGSMFRRSYFQKVLCSEGPVFRGSTFRRSYVQKVLVQKIFVQKVLYSEGSVFRRSYIQICSECPVFRKFFVLCWNKLTSRTNLFLRDFTYSKQPRTRSDHSRIVPAIQEYDTISISPPSHYQIIICTSFI